MTHDEVRDRLRGGDSLQVIDALVADGDAVAVAERFQSLANDLYWKCKDLRAAVTLSQAGIHFAITRTTTGEERLKLRGIAKAMAYNLASFCLPIWDEPGITLTPTDVAIGTDAARVNRRLAHELSRPAAALGNADWLIGAYHLVDQRFCEAIDYFHAATERFAEKPAMMLMARSYHAMADMLRHPEDAARTAAYAASLGNLLHHGSDDANAFEQQIRTACTALTRWHAANQPSLLTNDPTSR